MKVNLSFDLSNKTEKQEYQHAKNGEDYYAIINTMYNHIKYHICTERMKESLDGGLRETSNVLMDILEGFDDELNLYNIQLHPDREEQTKWNLKIEKLLCN